MTPGTVIDLPPLQSLRALLAESRIKLAEDAPPMAAGVFGYMGYDMVRLMEDLPEPNPDTLELPDSMFIRPTVMAIFDSVRDEVTVTSPVYVETGVTARAAYARAQERISEIVDALDRPLDHLAMREDAPPITEPRSNTTPEEYKAMAREKLLQRLQFVDGQLAGKDYLMGEQFTVADGYLFTVTNWAKPTNLDISGLANLAAYRERVGARPAVQAAMKAEGLLK